MSKGSPKDIACWTPSPLLRLALRASEPRQYQWAQAIGVHRTTLSAWLCGIVLVRRDDRRIALLARLLRVPRDKALVRRAPMAPPDVNAAAVGAALRLAAHHNRPRRRRPGGQGPAARGRTPRATQDNVISS